MRVLGIIVEYNPLHYGHIHHIEQSKKITGADLVVAVMSSHVVQRGEFSCVDKFNKTRWALKAGIDLVVELPGIFALQSADIFARTSVQILNALGVSDIVFGSETGELQPLRTCAEIMRTTAFDERVKRYLAEGYSYPSSTDLALGDLTAGNDHQLPNNILGIQYLQSIHKINPAIKAHVIKRVAAQYHDVVDETKKIQSASGLRKRFKAGKPIINFVPSYVAETINTMVDMHDFESTILYLIRSHTAESLNAIFSFEAGLENLFLSAEEATSLESMYRKLVSKRYTQSKLKRAIMHMLLNIKKSELTDFDIHYLRILGMNTKGRKYLNAIKKDVSVPLITKIKRERHPYLDIELRISRIYDLANNTNFYNQEFEPVIIL